MSLQQWFDNGWLRQHETSKNEISDLLAIVDRDLKDAQYMDACRSKRNIAEYNRVGAVTERDAEELVQFVKEFKNDVINWLKKNRPDLI